MWNANADRWRLLYDGKKLTRPLSLWERKKFYYSREVNAFVQYKVVWHTIRISLTIVNSEYQYNINIFVLVSLSSEINYISISGDGYHGYNVGDGYQDYTVFLKPYKIFVKYKYRNKGRANNKILGNKILKFWYHQPPENLFPTKSPILDQSHKNHLPVSHTFLY